MDDSTFGEYVPGKGGGSISYNVQGLPDGLPAGTYATRVLNARWVVRRDGVLDWVVEMEFVGPAKDDEPCLFPLIKTDVSGGSDHGE